MRVAIYARREHDESGARPNDAKPASCANTSSAAAGSLPVSTSTTASLEQKSAGWNSIA